MPLIFEVSFPDRGLTDNRCPRGCHVLRRCAPEPGRSLGLYELGLSNVNGRPTPLIGNSSAVDDDLLDQVVSTAAGQARRDARPRG
jgi:hypothetical protein